MSFAVSGNPRPEVLAWVTPPKAGPGASGEVGPGAIRGNAVSGDTIRIS